MLQLILGRSGSGKTHYLRNLILKNINLETRKFILLVPEHQLFENKHLFLNVLGESFNSKVEIFSFKELIGFIYEKAKKAPPKAVSKSEQIILMSLAIREVYENLNLFKEASKQPEFTELMVSLLNKFKVWHISDFKLKHFEETATNQTDNILYQKIKKIRLVLNSYDKVVKKHTGAQLPNSNRLYGVLGENNIFSQYSVLIDGFDAFTPQALSLIEKIIIQSENCYITFPLNSLAEENTDIFSSASKSLAQIIKIATNSNVKIAPNIVLDSSKKFSNDELKILEENIFRNRRVPSDEHCNNIFLYSAQNKYEEIDFVCRRIMKLIINENYRLKEIAVVTRNPNMYKDIIDIYFKKYNLPYFIKTSATIESKPLMKFLTNTIKIILSKFSSESIINYLKVGLLKFSTEDISSVENYAATWELSADEWLTGFFKSPAGSRCAENEELNSKNLEMLNNLRQEIVEPLIELKNKVTGPSATAFDITTAIYAHIAAVGVPQKLKILSKIWSEDQMNDLADEQVKLWDILIEILDQMVVLLNGKKISLQYYYDLMTLVIKSTKLPTKQRHLDEIIISDAETFSGADLKIAFLIGATQGEFPLSPSASGIFSNDEKKQLSSAGIELPGLLEDVAINEKYLAYKSVTAPSEKLFVSWPMTAVTGEKKRESEIVKEIKSIFKNIRVNHKFSEDQRDEVFALNPAMEICAAHFHDGSRFSETLKKYYLESTSDCKNKIKSLKEVSAGASVGFKSLQKINTLLKNNLALSPSSIEQFYMCPFCFFCKYILKLKNQKLATFDSLEYGSLVHFVLENVFKNYVPEALLDMPHEKIFEIVGIYLNNYINKKFGSQNNLSNRQQYLIKRTFFALKPLIIHIAEEIKQSKFKPKEFELSISKNGKFKPLVIELENGQKVEISGKIDRLDVMEKNGISYVRIIDYKTGAKEFKLSDLEYGLNTQLLLYMYIILNDESGAGRNKIPAGILFLPARKPTFSATKNISPSKSQDQLAKKLQMSGLILNSTEIILGMEPEGQGKFIPAVVKDNEPKKSSALVSLDEMKLILKQVKGLVLDMSNEVFSGNMAPLPIKGKLDACEHCDFYPICRLNESSPVKYKY